MPQARRAPRSDAFDPERSMQLRRSISIPLLPEDRVLAAWYRSSH
jgi:hypothetical protein